MTDRQNERLNMHRTVLKYNRKNKEVYSDIPAFVRYVDEHGACVEEIERIAAQQSGVPIKGATAHKGNAEEVLSNSCLMVAGALYSYAFESGNAELTDISSITKNSLFRSNGNHALSIARNISAAAAKLPNELKDYGISADDLKNLELAITNYDALIVAPRTAINERKLYTGGIAEGLAAADSILTDKMDKLALRFKNSNPIFYTGYKTARNIGRRKQKKTEEGEIEKKEGEVLEN